jgi:hypothetical protein
MVPGSFHQGRSPKVHLCRGIYDMPAPPHLYTGNDPQRLLGMVLQAHSPELALILEIQEAEGRSVSQPQ